MDNHVIVFSTRTMPVKLQRFASLVVREYSVWPSQSDITLSAVAIVNGLFISHFSLLMHSMQFTTTLRQLQPE